MEHETNTPSGTGYTTDEATLAISAILDSEDTTPVEAVVETDETTSDDDVAEAFEASDEHSEMNSDLEETDDDTETETTTDEPAAINDEYEIELADVGKVALGELKKGYLRQQDYTRKTQEVARTKQELEATIYGFNDKALAELENVKKQIAYEFKYNQPDWETLRQDDPYAFTEKRTEWDKRESLLQQLHAYEKQTRENQIAFEKQKFETDQAAARDYLSQKYSEFQNKDTAGPVMKDMVGLLKNTGFSREEIESVADGRILEIIYLAAKGIASANKAETAKKVIADTPKVTPVKSNPSTPRSSYQSLRQQFDNDRSNTDLATALISKLL